MLTAAEVSNEVSMFLTRYNGNITINPIVVNKQEDIYGKSQSQENLGITIQGGYHGHSGIVTFVASAFSDIPTLHKVIRHELLGHYGINTFTPGQKKQLINAILDTQNNPHRSLQKIWKKINTIYDGHTDSQKAEEVFATVAEQDSLFIHRCWSGVRSAFRKILRTCGLCDKPLNLYELQTVAQKVANGIKVGKRVQQTFPESDLAQFRKRQSARNTNTCQINNLPGN